MEKLVLIDGNSLLNRAFYATPVFTTKDGRPTNGVFGFIKLLFKIIADKNPTHMAVAFDVHAPTFRHQEYTDYKAGRKPMPEELASQFPVLKEVLHLMGICICEKAGYEADDLIGTLSRKFPLKTYIYTGDRDAYQLVDESTTICFTKKGVSDLLELSAENFKDEIGLVPSQIIDYKALMGDKSDNIPGVAGIGEKSAISLLERYNDLDGIYKHLEEISGAMHRKLNDGKDSAYFSKWLATINTDVPLDVSLADCIIKTPFSISVKNKFAELEFKSLTSKNLFEEEKTVGENSSETKSTTNVNQNLKEAVVENLEDVLTNLEAEKGTIACFWADDGVRIYCPTLQDTEYFIPIKMGLLDVGFYDYQLQPLLKRIYQGKNRVISYNVKEVMHRLSFHDIEHLAPFADLSVLKCIADGMANSDGLDFCLQYHNLNEKFKAYGLYYLHEKYFSFLRETEIRLYEDIELPLIPVLFDMEKQGVCVDEGILKEFSAKYTQEISQTTEEIYALAGERFNINSTQQLGKILFEKLRIGSGAKKTKESKSYKTTAEELEKYAAEYKIVQLILRYRKIQKLRSTYVDGLAPCIRNGRVHTTYNQSNTQTGRLSSANPNLQNIPIRTEEGRELRKLFTASEGNVLIDADYSQIELRLLAHFSGCKELIDAYVNGLDIHAKTASQVFNVPLNEVTPEMRRDAKAVNFGIIYGISAFGLGTDLGIAAKRAKEYIERYFESYSDVKSYMDNNVKRAATDGYVETLFGRRRIINEIHSANYNVRSFGERAAMNMPLQGSSADIIKKAMIKVFHRLKEGGYKAKLVLQVHDELIIDCPKAETEAVKTFLKEEMENAVSLKVPLTVDVNIGKNWFETK